MHTFNLSDYQSAFQNDTYPLGTLKITRGELVLADPFTAPYDAPLPFLHPVPCGEFKVEAAIKRFEHGGVEDERFAYVRITFSEIPARYWEMGLTAETVNEEFEEGEFVGALSETGYLALLDSRALGALPNPNRQSACESFEKALDAALQKSHQNTHRHATFPLTVKHLTHQLFAFTAGWGEGVYPLFFGYEREPDEHESALPVCAVVCLLLDD